MDYVYTYLLAELCYFAFKLSPIIASPINNVSLRTLNNILTSSSLKTSTAGLNESLDFRLSFKSAVS